MNSDDLYDERNKERILVLVPEENAWIVANCYK